MISMNRPKTGSRPYKFLLHNQTRNSDPKHETSQGFSLPRQHILPSLQEQQNCPPSGGADTRVCWCCPSSTPAATLWGFLTSDPQSCKRVSTGPVLHFTLEQLIILTKGEVTNHLILPARMCGKTGVIRRFPDKEERSVLGCHMPLPPG